MRQATVLALTILAVAGCGSSPASPSASPLPVSSESEHYVFHAATGDTVDVAWQEAYHQWAVDRLGVQPGRKIGYCKVH